MPRKRAPSTLLPRLTLPLPQPTPEAVLAARRAAGLSQTEANQLVSLSGIKGYRTWQRYEAPVDHHDHRAIPMATWVLFLLLTNQHPKFVLAKREKASQ